MDIEALKTELALPVYAALLAAGDDQGIADLLNAKTIDAFQPVPIPLLKNYMHQHGFLWVRLVDAQSITTPVAGMPGVTVGMVARNAVSYIEDTRQTEIDFRLETVQGMLAILVAYSVFLQSEIDALAALGGVKINWAEQKYGAGAIMSGSDVAQALHDGRQAVYEAQQTAIASKAAELQAANPDMPLREAMERADQMLHGADWGHS